MRYRDAAIVSLALILLLTSAAHAQSHFEKGIVVLEGGEYMYGYIDYGNWDRNPDEILFAKKVTKAPISLYPSDIEGFYVADEHYISAKVRTEISSIKAGDLSRKPHFRFGEAETFLQVVIEGEKSLFVYKDQEEKTHFYIRKEGELMLLKFKKYLKRDADKKLIGLNRAYIGQLITYLEADEGLLPLIQRTEYSRRSLERLFLQYYVDMDQIPAFYKEAEKVLIQPGVLVGLSCSKLDFKSSLFPVMDQMVFPVSYRPTVGFSLEFLMPRNHRKWSLQTELLYTSYLAKGSQTFGGSSVHALFGQSYLKTNNMLRYNFPYQRHRLFVNAGLATSLVLSEVNTQWVDGLSTFTVQGNPETPILSQTDAYEFEFFVGGGVRKDRFSAEFRYEFGNGPSRLVYMSSPMNRAYVMLGYRFGE